MVYNSNADNQDIVSLTGDLTNTDTTSYPLKAITRAVNKWNKAVWSWIFDAYGGMKYQDAQDTSDPFSDVNSVANTSKIAIPTAAVNVVGVGFLQNSVYNKLEPITLEQIQDQGFTLSSFMSTPSTPRFYLPIGNNIYIYPAYNTSLSSAYRIYFDRNSTSFASTATTATPGFNAEFHEVLAVGAAYEYASRKGLSNKNDLLLDLQKFEKRIKDFYAARYQELFPPQITVRDAVRDAQ